MLVNSAWLLEYLEPACTEDELLRAFVRMGLEVEAHRPLRRELEGVTVGFIREKSPLPGADGLYLCRAEVAGGETLQVVCASEHPVEVGWGVPVARGGTKLPTGIQVKNERYHGVQSEGMICLDSELGMLARGTGLQVFRDESAKGRRLVELLEIPDSILDLKATSNRPDWLGLVGIAREVAAVLGLSLKLPDAPVEESGTDAASLVRVRIEEPELCRRYACRLIRGVKISKSPAWLSSRLRSSGNNPINNVVDVTNFVMREWGQPLHAFDFHTLAGRQIVVRRMSPQESMELIDGTLVKGETRPLVIADAERPVALAGIMGGRGTQINDETVDVLLEAAHFDPVQIKKSLKELGVGSTDASYRFERGMDPNETLDRALERAASLIAHVAGGTVDRGVVEEYPNRLEPRRFQLTPERVGSYLGRPVDAATIRDCLGRLGMNVSEDLSVEVPTRRVDVNDPVVLIEDVARLTGYDQIPLAPSSGASTSGKRNPLDALRVRAAQFLAGNGFLESRNLSLVSAESVLQFSRESGDAVRLANGKEEMSLLRKSLLPGLLETCGRNARREAENFRYFELERTFREAPGGHVERWKVGAIAGGLTLDVDWSAGKTRVNFFHLKGVAESLLESLGVSGLTFLSASRPGFAEGQTAEVKVGDETLGVIGAIEKQLLASQKIKEPLYAFELDLQAALDAAAGVASFRDIPRTPAVVRDLAVVLDTAVPYTEIERRVREVGGALLEQVRCTDVYEGKPIERGSRSVSVRLRFRDPQRTLSAEEVAQAVETIVATLARDYGAKLRE
ncbi:MAG TPA: phenylalanine--tRNA ligase subunit beta [Pyrinomonadaceae bacterium]|nr:phenylalanine--tRNA ligase subunit beta [Pyrinomonadaceae bacterium]